MFQFPVNFLVLFSYKIMEKYNTGEPIPNGCYFESHIGVVITPDEKEKLQEFVQGLNDRCTDAGVIGLGGTCKLSQNFFKKSKDNSYINMLTYRDDSSFKDKFLNDVEYIKNVLSESGFEYEKVEVEYAVYDTNKLHDSEWING